MTQNRDVLLSTLMEGQEVNTAPHDSRLLEANFKIIHLHLECRYARAALTSKQPLQLSLLLATTFLYTTRNGFPPCFPIVHQHLETRKDGA